MVEPFEHSDMVCDECGQRFVFVGPRVSDPEALTIQRVAHEHFDEKHPDTRWQIRTTHSLQRRTP